MSDESISQTYADTWVAEVDRIDRALHRLGVPPEIRIKAVAQVMTVLAEAEKTKRNRADLILEAVNGCRGDVRKAAKKGWLVEIHLLRRA